MSDDMGALPGSREPSPASGLGPPGFDPARVFAEMDLHYRAAIDEGLFPRKYRVADSLLRDLSVGGARLAKYRDLPVECADEWSWGWMLGVIDRHRGVNAVLWFTPRDRDAAPREREAVEAAGQQPGPQSGIAEHDAEPSPQVSK